jgi:hypothetical protein
VRIVPEFSVHGELAQQRPPLRVEDGGFGEQLIEGLECIDGGERFVLRVAEAIDFQRSGGDDPKFLHLLRENAQHLRPPEDFDGMSRGSMHGMILVCEPEQDVGIDENIHSPRPP